MNKTVETTGWRAVKQTWTDPDRWAAVLLAAAPSLVFVLVNAVDLAVPGDHRRGGDRARRRSAYRLIRRQSPRPP